MSFKIPSYKNSINERRSRRAAWKATIQKTPAPSVEQEMARIEKLATAIIAAGYVTKIAYGFRVQVSPMNWQDVIENGGLFCACKDAAKFGTCAHLTAVEKFTAAREEFHYQAGEIELFYDNTGVWEAA